MTNTNMLRSIPIFAALMFAGCGGSTPGGSAGEASAPSAAIAGSCYVEATGNCSEWVGAEWAQLTMNRLCTSQKGTFSAGACPTANLVGSCLRDQGKKSASTFFYYTNFPGYGVTLTPDAVAKDGKDQCTQFMKGEWRANVP